MSFQSPRVTVMSSPSRGTVSIHTGDIMIEVTAFDAEDLGRKLVESADDCVAHPNYVPADEAIRPGDPCPRCQSTETRVMQHEEIPGLVCSTCNYGT